MKLRDIIFCDDVRTETHNKFSLMGIYTDRIVFKFDNPETERWPLPVKLCLVLRISVDDKDPEVDFFLFNFKINGKNSEPLSGEVKMKRQQSLMTLNIVMDGLPVEKGALGFDLKLLSNKKEVFTVSQEEALKVMSEIAPLTQ